MGFCNQLPDGLSLKTQSNVINALNKLFNDTYNDEIITKIPIFPKISIPEPAINWVDEETQDKIIAEIPQRDQPIFILMARTGLRPGEARALKRKDINFKEKYVIIDKAFSEKTFRPFTKNKTSKIVLIDDYTVNILQKIQPINPDHFMFTTTKGTHYSHSSLLRIFNEAKEKVGIHNLTLYQGMKHSFASQAINRGVPKDILQKYLGHKNSSATDRYAKLNLDSLKICTRPIEAPKRPQEKNSEIIPFKNKKLQS